MADLKDFNFKHWWTLLAAGGAVIAAGSIASKHIPGFLGGLGLLLFGVGASVDHPRTPKKETVEGLHGFKVVDDYPWTPTAFGVILSVLGIALFGFCLFQVLRS